jgi:chromosome segregation ATPase
VHLNLQVTQLSDELQRLSSAAVKGGSSSAAVGQLQAKLSQAEGDNFRLSEALANVESKMGALTHESQQLVHEMENKMVENSQLKAALSAKDQEMEVVSRQLSSSGLHVTEIDRLRQSELDATTRSDSLARQLEYEVRCYSFVCIRWL